jgi:hypothetical protein
LWFDQEKLSRLVKKVGPKKLSEPLAATTAPSGNPSAAPAPSASQPLPPAPSASQRLPEPVQMNGPALEAEPALENLASTARISLVSKPPSLLAENRALPALPRRTTPLPGLKSLFQPPAPGDKPFETPPNVEMPAVITQPLPDAPKPEVAKPEEPKREGEQPITLPKAVEPPGDEEDDLAGIWQKMALLNEELAQTIQERDHALGDINMLRDQLQLSDEQLEKSKSNTATPDELALIAKERDDAVAEMKALKEKAAKTDSQKIQLPDGVSKTKELVFLTQERDQARKEYADLRKQFEGFKREQSPGGPPPLPREDSSKVRKELEQQLEGFRQKLEEKNRELAELKANPPAPAMPPPLPVFGGESDEKLKTEVTSLKEQLAKAREDASIAQRGLALSQKALQETRDTLREATEGTSLSRHNFDNLKNEIASLTQQNSVLQAQNEQFSRELAAQKQQRQSGRLS